MTIPDFAAAAIAYCELTRGSITSWYRTPQHNATVGGSATSRHLEALAVDVVYDKAVDKATADGLAESYGLQVLRESDHDHISPAGGPH